MPNAPRNGNRARVDELTQQGLSATQIGKVLNIAPNTVYSHRHAIRKRRTLRGLDHVGHGDYYDQQYSLSKLTTEEYIRDPRFSVIGVGTKVNDGPTQWVSGPATEVLEHLRALPWDNAMLLAHKTMFDGAILSWRCGITPKALADTYAHVARVVWPRGISHSLKAVAERYGVGEKGDEVVRALGKRRTEFEPDELARYGEYCVNDVQLTYDIFQRMLADGFPMKELKLIDVTLRMFTEPMLELDGAHLRTHLQNVQARKQALLDAAGVTDKKDLMSNQKFAEMLRSFGVEPPMKISATTGKETYAFAKTDEDFKALEEHEDERVQTLVAARLGNKSTLEETRTERFIDIASRGKLPGTYPVLRSPHGPLGRVRQDQPAEPAKPRGQRQADQASHSCAERACVDRRRLRADRSTGAGMAG
jgi:hypothetical protein